MPLNLLVKPGLQTYRFSLEIFSHLSVEMPEVLVIYNQNEIWYLIP